MANPHIFTKCPPTKLMEDGAGRQLSVGDERIVTELVRSSPEDGYGFVDLIVAATTSEVFLAR